MMRCLARRVRRFDLRLVPVPLAIAPAAVAAVWHERYSAEPAQRFFGELVQWGSPCCAAAARPHVAARPAP